MGIPILNIPLINPPYPSIDGPGEKKLTKGDMNTPMKTIPIHVIAKPAPITINTSAINGLIIFLTTRDRQKEITKQERNSLEIRILR